MLWGKTSRSGGLRLSGTDAVGSATCGLADNQFRFDHGLAAPRIMSGTPDAAEQSLGGDSSHFAQRLTHRGRRRILVGGTLNVVEAHHGNVVRNPQLGFAKGADGTHRGNVVKGKWRGESLARSQQLAGGFVS